MVLWYELLQFALLQLQGSIYWVIYYCLGSMQETFVISFDSLFLGQKIIVGTNLIRKIKEIQASNHIWKNFIFDASNSLNLAWFGYSPQLYAHFSTKNFNFGSKVDFRKSIFFQASEALHMVSFDNFVESMPSCLPKLKIMLTFCFPNTIPDMWPYLVFNNAYLNWGIF